MNQNDLKISVVVVILVSYLLYLDHLQPSDLQEDNFIHLILVSFLLLVFFVLFWNLSFRYLIYQLCQIQFMK